MNSLMASDAPRLPLLLDVNAARFVGVGSRVIRGWVLERFAFCESGAWWEDSSSMATDKDFKRKVMSKQIKISTDEFPEPAPGKVVITLNMKAGKLHYLTSKEKRYQYFAKDEKAIPDATDEKPETTDSESLGEVLLECDRLDEEELDDNEKQNIAIALEGEDVKKSVRAAYKMAKIIRAPKRFTSMAARIQGFPASNSDLTPYGDVVVVVDPKAVRDHLVVFSGDVKTLGDAILRNEGSHAKAWRIKKSPSVLAKQLRTYRRNPKIAGRAIGRYFEARLLRALKATDISEIYVPKGDDAAWKAASEINELKLRRLNQRRKRH